MNSLGAVSLVKVILGTNRIENLDLALIIPSHVDRGQVPPAWNSHKQNDITLDDLIVAKNDLSGADTKTIYIEAGLFSLREHRMKVTNENFEKNRKNFLNKKQEVTPEGFYF